VHRFPAGVDHEPFDLESPNDVVELREVAVFGKVDELGASVRTLLKDDVWRAFPVSTPATQGPSDESARGHRAQCEDGRGFESVLRVRPRNPDP